MAKAFGKQPGGSQLICAWKREKMRIVTDSG
jgi:hypothetical protein